MKISCPWCGVKVDNRLDKLAEHIFKDHSENAELCAWAREEQIKLTAPVKVSITDKIVNSIQKHTKKESGKSNGNSQEKLPKYLRDQLK